jgi:predicted nucleotidyltransferase
MDKAAAIGCVKQYADVVRRNFRVKKVLFYGSYLRDAAREDSDIDVAVVVERV